MAAEYYDRRLNDDGDIDLGRYAAALGRRWRVVVGVTLLTIVVAAGASLALAAIAPRYQAQATVLLTGAKYRLQLDPKFTTVETLNSVSTTRTEEYQAVASAPETERAAEQQLTAAGGRELAPTEVKAKGNVLTITARSGDAAVAAASANAFAAAAAARLDAVYGIAEADQTALQRELEQAVARHANAEERLAQMTRDDRSAALVREIEQKELTIRALTGGQNAQLGGRLGRYYQASADLEQIRRDAETLRAQVQGAAQAPASTAAQALALMNLQSRLTAAGSGRQDNDPTGSGGASPGSPSTGEGASRGGAGTQVQLGVDALVARAGSQQDVLRDVEAVIAQARERQTAFQQEFDAALDEIAQRAEERGRNLAMSGDDRTQQIVEKLTADIQALRAQIQEHQYRQSVLTQEVELAKTARTTLESKLREASISAATVGGKAIVASTAVTPGAPSFPPPLSRTLPLAAFLGLLLGAVVAIARDSWSKPRTEERAPVPSEWRAREPARSGTAGE